MQYLEDKVSRINGELYYNTVHEQIHLATKFTSRVPLEGWIFGAQRAKTSSPPVTPKVKVREVSSPKVKVREVS